MNAYNYTSVVPPYLTMEENARKTGPINFALNVALEKADYYNQFEWIRSIYSFSSVGRPAVGRQLLS